MLKNIIPAATAAVIGLAGTSASALSIDGSFWDTGGLGGRAAAEAAIAASATATFTSTAIDYPNGSTRNVQDSATTVEQYLGVDGSSLSGANSTLLTGSVFQFTGSMWLDGGAQTFAISSDDGFWLKIDGVEVTNQNTNRGFRTTTYTTSGLSRGKHSFELVYWENTGWTGVEARVNGQLFDTALSIAPVPVPASMPLLVAGLGGLAFLRRRRQR